MLTYTAVGELDNPRTDWTRGLPRCPRVLNNPCNSCPGPSARWSKIHKANPEHQPGVWEIRSIATTKGGPTNQCVYDANGDIMDELEVINGKTSFAPGSADKGECPNPPFCWNHTRQDYATWNAAKRQDAMATRRLRKEYPRAPESTLYRKMYFNVRPILVEK